MDKYFASSRRDLVKFSHDDIYVAKNLVVLLRILLQRVILIFILTCLVVSGLKNEKETGRTMLMPGCISYSPFFWYYRGSFYMGIFKLV